jgi:hypothetical protein
MGDRPDGLHRFGFAVPRIEIDQRLPVDFTDDIRAPGILVGAPGCREAEFRHLAC